MSHVTHVNKSCYTYASVISRMWISHVTYMNESCQPRACIMRPHEGETKNESGDKAHSLKCPIFFLATRWWWVGSDHDVCETRRFPWDAPCLSCCSVCCGETQGALLRCDVAMWSFSFLQCVAVCCSNFNGMPPVSLFTVFAAENPKVCCCSVVLQCVAVCCRVFNGMPPAFLAAVSAACNPKVCFCSLLL